MLLVKSILKCLVIECANAALTQVTNFGSNPAGIQMWIEVPTNVAPKAPVIVAVSEQSKKGLRTRLT